MLHMFQQEELEFVDDLRALYDKKLISNEAKVKYENDTDEKYSYTRGKHCSLHMRMTQLCCVEPNIR